MPKPVYDSSNLFSNLAFEINSAFASSQNLKNIMDFIETEIDQEKWGITLNIQQRVILKTFYSLELTIEEESIIESWLVQDKTTWGDNKESYQALVLEAGRRGGKSQLGAIIACYEFYKLCHLPEPQKHYGIASSTPISILALATSASQAKRTIFAQIVGMLRVCKYFLPLINQQKIFIGKEAISYDEKMLNIYSGNSQSSSQVGQSVILLIMDEATRFKDVDGDSNALELWSNIGISGINFGADAKRVAISSAWYSGDAIEKLYESSQIDPTWLGFRLRTWDLNPMYHRDNPIIASEYNINPKRAALECEGVRSASEDSFFDQDEVKACFKGRSTVISEQVADPDGLIRHYLTRLEPATYTSVVHLDPSVSTDTYALAIGHAEKRTVKDETINTLTVEDNTIVVIDGVLTWKPDPTSCVSITNVQHVMLEIHKRRSISKVTADHHNSWETLERMRAYGIKSESLYFSQKLQLEMYENLRLLIHEGRLILPKDSPNKNLLLDELVRIQLIKGKKIDHPKGFSKDTADAIAGVAWVLTGKSTNYLNAPYVYKTVSLQKKSARTNYFNEFGTSRYQRIITPEYSEY